MGEPSKVKIKDHPALTSDEHTPGPWVVSSTFLVCNQEARIVARCQPDLDIPDISVSVQEARANAELIAQAPTLLAQNRELVEALERMITVCDGLDDYIRRGIPDNQQRRADEATESAKALLAKLGKS